MLNVVTYLLISITLFSSNLFSQNFWAPTGGPTENITTLAQNSNGHIFAGTLTKGIFKSTDDGNTWNEINHGVTNFKIQVLSVGNNGDLFAGTNGDGIFRSTNNGDSWVQINSGLTNLYIADIGVNAQGDIFSVTGFSRIFRSIDNGDNWILMNNGNYISASSLLIRSNGYLYVGGNYGVYRSTDNGITWSHIGLETYVGALALGPSGRIYAAEALRIWSSLSDGIYWSYLGYMQGIYSLIVNANEHVFAGHLDEGVFINTSLESDGWTQLNQGLTNLDVHALLINPNGYIFVGTLGGGVFRSVHSTTTAINDKEAEIPFSFFLAQNYPNPFNPATTISYSIPSQSFVSLKVSDVLGNEIATLVNEEKPAGNYELNFKANGLSSGIYFYRIQAGNFTDTKKFVLMK